MLGPRTFRPLTCTTSPPAADVAAYLASVAETCVTVTQPRYNYHRTAIRLLLKVANTPVHLRHPHASSVTRTRRPSPAPVVRHSHPSSVTSTRRPSPAPVVRHPHPSSVTRTRRPSPAPVVRHPHQSSDVLPQRRPFAHTSLPGRYVAKRTTFAARLC